MQKGISKTAAAKTGQLTIVSKYYYYKKKNCAKARFLTVVVVEAYISMIDAKVDS
jgi:hypothetical protein